MPASTRSDDSSASTPVQDPKSDAPDTVDTVIEEFGARLRTIHERVLDEIANSVLQPVTAAIDDAAARHHELLNQFRTASRGLAEQTAADDATHFDGESAWHALSQYLDRSRRLVLDPVCATIRRIDCGLALHRALDPAIAELDGAVEALQATLERTEPAALHEPAAGDPLRWRIGKRLVLTTRAIHRLHWRAATRVRQLLRQPVVVQPAPRQTVPVQLLAAYHVHTRMPRVRLRVLEQIQTGLASRVAGLERAFDEWTHAALTLTRELDSPALHQPHDSRRFPGDTSGPAQGSSADGPRMSAVFEHADRLDHLLNENGSAAGPAAAATLNELLRQSHEALRQDVAHVGSFMLAPEQRQPGAEPTRDARDLERRFALWTEWHRQAVARLTLDSRLISLRVRIAEHAETVLASVERDSVQPTLRVLESVGVGLHSIRNSLRSSFERSGEEGSYTALPAELRDAAGRAIALLDQETAEQLAVAAPEASTRTAAEQMIDGFAADIGTLEPLFVVHRLPETGRTPDPSARKSEVRFREIAEQAFDVVLLERMRRSPDNLAATLEASHNAAEDLNIVIRFNLNAAVEELQAGEDGSGTARLQAAEELALNGIDQTRAALDHQAITIRKETGAFAAALHEIMLQGWSQLHDRIKGGDRVQEQFLDLRYRIGSALRDGAATVRRRAERLAGTANRLLRAAQSRARRLVRLGQSAVEGEQVTEESRQHTIDALASIDDVLARLPRVYRRLFAFEPLVDDAMLVGRSADIFAIKQHFDHWRMGQTDAIVVSGFDGNGLTSFLNILPAAVFADAAVRRLAFHERQTDEADLADSIGKMLGLHGAAPRSLDELANRIVEMAAPEQPIVGVLENLEQTLLRTPSGSGLVRRLLAFLSRTDFRVFWVAAVARQAWLYVERVEPTAARLVRHHPLSSIPRDGIRDVILSRHLRSGMPLHFVPPDPLPPLLKRRLRRAGTETDRQTALRQDYFDRLGRLCGGNLVLAMLYWLRSASLDEQTRVFRIHPIEPLSFAHLEALTLDQSFTLKAMLDHGTLTLEEHDDIFGLPHESSRHIFESLGNQFLIEPADSDGRLTNFSFTTVAEKRPHRIRPLVMHPVISHLRSRNLIL